MSSRSDVSGQKRRRLPQATFDSAPKLFDDEEAKKNKSLKNRIRSIERLLKKPGLPKQALKDKERLLRKLKAELELGGFEKQEQAMGAKYHAVKFFEKQKLTRRIKQVEALVAELESKRRLLAGDDEADSTGGQKTSAAKKPLIEPATALDSFPEHLRHLAAEVFPADAAAAVSAAKLPGHARDPGADQAALEAVSRRLDSARALLRELQLDVLYVKWYPRHLKYVALFPAAAATTTTAAAAVAQGGTTQGPKPLGNAEESSSDESEADGSDDELESGDGAGSRPSKRPRTSGDNGEGLDKKPAGEAIASAREKKKRAKWQDARRWALANAAAGDYLREPPSAPVAGADMPASTAPTGHAETDTSSPPSAIDALIKKRLQSALAFGSAAASGSTAASGDAGDQAVGRNRVKRDLPPPPEDDEDEPAQAAPRVARVPAAGKAETLRSKATTTAGGVPATSASSRASRIAQPLPAAAEDEAEDDLDSRAPRGLEKAALADDPFFRPASDGQDVAGGQIAVGLLDSTASAPAKRAHSRKKKRSAVHETFESSSDDDEGSDGGHQAVTTAGKDRGKAASGDPYDGLDLPVFKEVPFSSYDEEGSSYHRGPGAFTGEFRREPGVARFGAGVTGKQTSAARYEREHMGAKRYRDNAAQRMPQEAVDSNADEAGKAAGLSHLSDRKRRRAERAAKWAAEKGIGPSGSDRAVASFTGGRTLAGVSGLRKHSSNYREALFGTTADSGARLKSEGVKPSKGGMPDNRSFRPKASHSAAPYRSNHAASGGGAPTTTHKAGHVKFT